MQLLTKRIKPKSGTSLSIKGIVFLLALLCLLPLTTRCNQKMFTIGIICPISTHTQVVDGFKEGMAELGYTEGLNVRYIYNGLMELESRIFDEELRSLRAQGADTIITTGNGPSERAAVVLKDTGTPVVVVACDRMIERGIVKSLTHPDGDITGVAVADTTAKTLEWVAHLIPGANRVYLPYNPKDDVSKMHLPEIMETAHILRIDLLMDEVASIEEAISAIENLPEEVDAIYRIPSPTLGPGSREISQAAIAMHLPVISDMPLGETTVMNFSSDMFEMGKQAARFVHQIRLGVKPKDLPIEIAEAFLTVNLKTAEEIDLAVPSEVLVQAKSVVR